MIVMMVEMMMMIPMKSNSMTVTMAMISPLWEGISPADFSPPESFSLSVVFRPAEAAENFLDGSLGLRVSGDEVREGGRPVVGQGSHTLWRRGQGWARATTRCGPLVAHLWLPFWLPPSSGEI